jgi:cell division protease FtsH
VPVPAGAVPGGHAPQPVGAPPNWSGGVLPGPLGPMPGWGVPPTPGVLPDGGPGHANGYGSPNLPRNGHPAAQGAPPAAGHHAAGPSDPGQAPPPTPAGPEPDPWAPPEGR